MGLFTQEHPQLLTEMNLSSENHPVDLSTLTSGSGKIVEWKCQKGHTFTAPVRRRTQGSGCPYCAGSRVLQGFNDLATTHPHLITEWAEKSLTPQEISAGSNKKVAWQCEAGHQRVLSVRERVKGAQCQQCHTDQRSQHIPMLTDHELLTQFHPQRNTVDVNSVKMNSQTKIWWVCSEKHEWEASVKNRYYGRGCPYCSGTRVLPGFNDLATTHPHLLSEWDDLSITPQSISAGSVKEVSWKCKLGHQWTQAVNIRTKHDSSSCPYCSGTRVLQGFNDLATTHPHLIKEWADDSPVTHVSAGSKFIAQWVCAEGHTWSVRVNERTRTQARGCPVCHSSHGEREMTAWLQSVTSNVHTRSRSVIAPHELDLYLPDHHLAVEYNGLYWHSEKKGKDSSYHEEKTRACADQDIQLVHVWEDDWQYRQPIVKRMLLNKLGLSQEVRVPGRKTTVLTLDGATVEPFMEANHIQGHKHATYYYGLVDETGTVVAVMSLTGQDSTLLLDRYATSVMVQGGFTKLLRHVVSVHSAQFDEIVTFADLTVSDGGLYDRSGFINDGVIRPDYKYVVNGRRVHKFNFRKDKFRTNPTLKYEEGLTEKELAELNGLNRIWDAGKIRYVLRLKNLSD